MTNTFFERNTISNWNSNYSQREGMAKMRSKRVFSHSELKIDPTKFQHRQVFDSKIYEKVNFFRLGLKDLRQKNEKEHNTHYLNTLKQILSELSLCLNDKNVSNFGSNYVKYWGLFEDSPEKAKVTEAMTQALNIFLKRIVQKVEQINKAKHEVEQHLMRLQVDLKLSRKQQIRLPQSQLKLNDKHVQRQKKLRQKLKVLDFELKKQSLKSHQLQQRLIEQGNQIEQLKKNKTSLLNEIQKDRSYKQTMQFKVKRLKEELQVSNIIKQQNLADKMKYIMNW